MCAIRPVEQQYGMRAPDDVCGYLFEVKLHGLGIGEGKRQARARAARRTDGPEEIGAFVALVGGLVRPRSSSRPLPDKAVLLANPRLVLEPDLDRLAPGYPGEVRCERAAEFF